MDTAGTSSVGVGNGSAAHEAEVAELLAELSAKQRVVIDALILGLTVTGAAEKAGVHRGTVSRWILKDVHFIAALNARELEVIRAGHTRWVNLVPTALMTIENAINNGDVRAALQVMKYALSSGKTVGSISSQLVAKEMQVSELRHKVALDQQQADLEQLDEETSVKSKSVALSRNLRIYNERRAAEEAAAREERRREETARKAAEGQAKEAQAREAREKEAREKEAPRQAASAQKHMSLMQPKPAPSSSAQSHKHPGQSDSRERDVRIAAAAQSVASVLSNPGTGPRQSAASPDAMPDASPAQNPGTQAAS